MPKIRLANTRKVLYNTGMKIALFGGSFDPVHQEHVRYVQAAKAALGLDKVFVIPSHIAPHKLSGAAAGGEDRFEMCRLAFRNLPYVQVSDLEIASEGTSYTYLTCRRFKELYPCDELYFLVGADMLEDFFTWKQPEDILSNATLAACRRENDDPAALHSRFVARFSRDFVCVPFAGEAVASHRLRVDLAFRRPTPELDRAVRRYIEERRLYTHPAIAPALALEKPSRREHSYRVACMAVARARSAGVSEGKALIAAALHDCAKYVPLSSPLLEDFTPPAEVPPPVMHEYTGAYLARHAFGIEDEDILDAIRYHTSGKAGMAALSKLIFLADMLEEGRSFDGVEALRALFWEDLDACFYAALRAQVEYLRETGKPVYPLTEEAYLYEKSRRNTKN